MGKERMGAAFLARIGGLVGHLVELFANRVEPLHMHPLEPRTKSEDSPVGQVKGDSSGDQIARNSQIRS